MERRRRGPIQVRGDPIPSCYWGWSDHYTALLPDHLTMRQAARNAEGRRNLWSGSQLRHRAVNFVSADGTGSEGMDTPPSEPNEANREPLETKPSAEQDATEADLTVDREKVTDASSLPIDAPDESTPETHTPNPNTAPCLFTPGDSPQVSPEDSSEDEIVFSGRYNTRKPIRDPQYQSGQIGSDFLPTPRYATEDEAGRTDLDGEEREEEAVPTAVTRVLPESYSATGEQYPQIERATSMDLSEGADYLGINPTPAKRRTRRAHSEGESDHLDDYIANMDGDYDDILRAYNLKGDLAPEPDSESSSQRSSSQSATHDLDALFEAGSPPASGSKWKFKIQRNDPTGMLTEPEERRGTRNDLQLGPGLDDYLISESEAEEIDLDVLQSEIVGQSSNRTRKHGMPELWPFQSASASADALELDPLFELDIQDFSKADLKKKSKKKQRRMAFELNLSDSELEFELEQAWQKDRGKKKIKKQKREELRAQGMLGRGAGKPDLRAKYSDGMDIDEFRVETKRFLLSSKNRWVSIRAGASWRQLTMPAACPCPQ